MNFLEIVNKCLAEMNCRKIYKFSELIKVEHKRILDAINLVNDEICHLENWDFLKRRTQILLPAGSTEILNSVNGKIQQIWIDGLEYKFTPEIKPFLSDEVFSDKVYSSIENKLLFPKFESDKTLEIIYFTNNCAVNENGAEIKTLSEITDESLIPMPFAEQLLVYGACLRIKANPQYFKFSYWLSMYKEALLNLKSKALVAVQDSPKVSLFRD